MPARDALVGGQAVLEGVMMRGARHWAVAVRRPAESDRDAAGRVDRERGAHGEIEVEVHRLDPWARRHRAYRLPVVRGVVALAESLVIGSRALATSAGPRSPTDEKRIGGGTRLGAVAAGVIVVLGLFFTVPAVLASLVETRLGPAVPFWLVEGVLRTGIFCGYLWVLSRMRDLRRVLEYHGAEHKAIACHEAGDDLVPERAARYSRLHPRCGTTFLLIVMVVAIPVFAPVGLPAWPWLLATRILGVPLIAGIAFEVIRIAGRNRRRRWVQVVMSPGMQLQRLTTREPDHGQLAVAIAALRAVLEREDPSTAGRDDRSGMEVVA